LKKSFPAGQADFSRLPTNYRKHLIILQNWYWGEVLHPIKTVARSLQIFHHSGIDLCTESVHISGQGARP